MFKGISAFVCGALIAGSVFAGAEPLDCQTSSSFEKNLDDLNEVTSKVNEGQCPKPTEQQFKNVCHGIYNTKTIEKPGFSYTYQEELWRISCADPDKDTIETARTKVQSMWLKYRQDFRCYNYPTSVATDKNVLKFSMDNNFAGFIYEAVKRYKLDLNFKDPADQKTIMDFLKERKEYIQNSPPVDNLKVAEYDKIYKYLETHGAKHAKDL